MSARPLVLLIEDNESDVLLFERAVAGNERPFPFTVAFDGVDAIRYLSDADRTRHPLPGLILLDLKLPRKSGLEVLEWKTERADLKDIPVVVLTSSSELDDIRGAFRLGVRAYVVKPVGFDQLRSLVGAISGYLDNLPGGPDASLRGFLTPRPSL
ncbi:MAG TPA: response regulator [Planctomycetota bacterium]